MSICQSTAKLQRQPESFMKFLGLTLLTSALLLSTLSAHADDGEITIRIIEDDSAVPENIVRELTLPAPADRRGAEASEPGRDTAGQAREQRRGFGESTARDRRDQRATPERGRPDSGATPPGRP